MQFIRQYCWRSPFKSCTVSCPCIQMRKMSGISQSVIITSSNNSIYLLSIQHNVAHALLEMQLHLVSGYCMITYLVEKVKWVSLCLCGHCIIAWFNMFTRSVEFTSHSIVYLFPLHCIAENLNKLPAGWSKIIEINRVAGRWFFLVTQNRKSI